MDTTTTAQHRVTFRYVVHTVSALRLTGETVATGVSAQAVLEDFLARGYVKVEVAPAAPVNGFRDAVAGVDYLPGDTASHDTRTPANVWAELPGTPAAPAYLSADEAQAWTMGYEAAKRA